VAGWVLVVAGQHEAVLVEVLGSVERDQIGQRAGAGRDLDQGADVAGLGAGGGRRWQGGTRRCWWSGWALAGTSSSCSG
jgi:hypothetical protein